MFKNIIMKTRLGRLLMAEKFNAKMKTNELAACHDLAKAKQIVRMLPAYGRDAKWRAEAINKIDHAMDALADGMFRR